MSDQAAQTTNSAEVKPEAVTPETTPAVESKPAESMISEPVKAEEKEASPDPKAAKPAVPEKYELKLPEGSKVDAAYVAKIEATAKEKGWTNARAQESIDERHAAITEIEAQQTQTVKHLNEKTWKEELFNDPDFGGQKFEENGHLAYRAAERFGGKEFADFLKANNLNHQPTLFKHLVRVGRAMESDKLEIPGGQSPTGKPSEDEKLRKAYPSMFKPKE